MEAVKDQLALLKAQIKAQKELQREAAIKAEVGRHKSPQIKRSVKFIMSLWNMVEDMDELAKPFEDAEVAAENENVQLATETFSQISRQIGLVQQLLHLEMEMNQVASKEVLQSF
jgi:hypothetical protein